jgi:hypothetical protein
MLMPFSCSCHPFSVASEVGWNDCNDIVTVGGICLLGFQTNEMILFGADLQSQHLLSALIPVMRLKSENTQRCSL